VLGSPPQDLKYPGLQSHLVIGDRNVFREYVTANLATEPGEATRIGSDGLFMAYSHVAHNCAIGDRVVIANAVQLAGYVVVDDWAIVGGGTVVHQFTRIGRHSMIGGGSRISQDIAPFVKSAGSPPRNAGINAIGLERRGVARETRDAIDRAYRIFFRDGATVTKAVATIRRELPGIPEASTSPASARPACAASRAEAAPYSQVRTGPRARRPRRRGENRETRSLRRLGRGGVGREARAGLRRDPRGRAGGRPRPGSSPGPAGREAARRPRVRFARGAARGVRGGVGGDADRGAPRGHRSARSPPAATCWSRSRWRWTWPQADAMIRAAERAGRTLQVGQVERFNPALLAAGPFIQRPKFIEAHRMAAFQPRSLDIDVVGDLMIHDIDAVLHLTGHDAVGPVRGRASPCSRAPRTSRTRGSSSPTVAWRTSPRAGSRWSACDASASSRQRLRHRRTCSRRWARRS
jgi:acyl-ACP--UDP-N-acetylglucosamine O-acyltransferase